MLCSLSMTVLAVTLPVFNLTEDVVLLVLQFVAVVLTIAYQIARLWRHFKFSRLWRRFRSRRNK